MTEPTVTGPIAGEAAIMVVTERKLPAGYVEEEFFLTGTAASYVEPGTYSRDGKWNVTTGERAPYTTRLLVRRPADPTRHNGTVIVEWLNVSAGADTPPDWMAMHRHISRAGSAWVGVSAQRAGVEGGGMVPGPFLKQVDPDRYGPLSHPGDAYAFDIYTQAGRALRDGSGQLLGPLGAVRLLAVGESQSAMCLTTYLNAIAPLTRAYDGYLVHSRASTSIGLNGDFIGLGSLDEINTVESASLQARGADGITIRDDLDVPVLTLETETDVVTMSYANARQPDTDRFRLWEIAGTAHADTYMMIAASSHDDATTIEELAALCAPTTTPLGPEMPAKTPINAGVQHHYVAQAAIAALDAWVRDGTAPAAAARLETVGEPPALAVDEFGIARGGIRTGFVDVPAATLSGIGGEGEIFTVLFGTTRPFDAATLSRLYPGGPSEYALRFAAATADAVNKGFVLAEDAAEMNELARAMYWT